MMPLLRKNLFMLMTMASLLIPCRMSGQAFVLFDSVQRQAFPSVVSDFLERYLYEIDSLERAGQPIMQKMMDDKVVFLSGGASRANLITSATAFSLVETDDKYYQATWFDSLHAPILDIVFPMEYELLLGHPKVVLEQQLCQTLKSVGTYQADTTRPENILMNADSLYVSDPQSHYYVESLNTARYYYMATGSTLVPVFDSTYRWYSAANLFQGVVDSIGDYMLYVEQNVYGFKQLHYHVSLSQWLAYCQEMKFDVYFAVEEERQDGLMALLIAHSRELGFNHMMSIILPEDFTYNRKAVLKASLTAYIPTSNVKDLYQQYIKRPKKKI